MLLSYPWISNYLYQKSSGSKIKTFQNHTNSLSKTEYEEIYQKARRYNEELLSSRVKLTDPFQLQKKTIDYDDVLTLDSSGIMAYIEIPCIDAKLPIYHGTDGKTLKKGVGHLAGTSLPIGGVDTHSVLTGHTGLSSAKMFTDLIKMKNEDLFYVHVLGKTLAYKVDRISIVLPEDTEKLSVVKRRDMVTLVTCTPYGVNDHRLLVRGIRTKYVKTDQDHIKKYHQTQWMMTYQKAIVIGVLFITGLWMAGKIMKKIQGKRK